MKECVNCGEEYMNGDGFPIGVFDCCCSAKCWVEFAGESED